MFDHSLESFVRGFGMGDLHDLDLVELVQAVESAHILAVRAGFAAKTGRIGRQFDREVRFVDDYVAVDVRYRHLCGRNQVEVIHGGVVHLSLLVGQLTRAETGCLVDHQRGHHFGITGRCVVVEEKSDQCALQCGALAFVNRKSGSGQLDA